MGFYPQSAEDEILFDNFRDVVSKYRTLCLDGLIIKPANGVYPRLSVTHLRGSRAGEELVNFLCRCLIHHAPLSILEDIENAEFCFNPKYQILGSTQLVSFMVLQDKIPDFKIHNWQPPKTIELIDLKK